MIVIQDEVPGKSMRGRWTVWSQTQCRQEQHVQVSVQTALIRTPSEWTMAAIYTQYTLMCLNSRITVYRN